MNHLANKILRKKCYYSLIETSLEDKILVMRICSEFIHNPPKIMISLARVTK